MNLRIKDEIVRIVVNKALGMDFEIIDHNVEVYSKLKTGMIASHYLLIVKVKRLNEIDAKKELLYTFFVKSAYDLSAEGSRKAPISDRDSFLEEVNFFNKILPELTLNENKKFIFAPKCWVANQEMLIFEDLRSAGYSMCLETKFLNEELSKLAILTLAKFHATSILTEKRLVKSLKEIYSSSFKERHFSPESKLSPSVNVSLQTASQLIDYFGLNKSNRTLDSDVLRQRLAKMVESEPGRLNVICHGDVWRNNLMFSCDDCKLIDYQLLRYASPGTDLAMFMYLNCSPQFRKSSEWKMIQHYYRHLICNIKEGAVEVVSSILPSFEDIWSDYEKHKLIGAFYAMMFLPRTLMPTQIQDSLLSNTADIEKYLFGDRFQIILNTMNKYSEYRDIINLIVKEFSTLVDQK